ncbi:lipoyltransferase 1, mitochondrial-like [Pollicipes pollicipes]|uniref:lipoyltransferase 1, mitochondrial-like n=1 Tax=Pollicipes pollicipes TaxID=41117 RepID=UPI00188573D8|nr:lipoyltransferase 1, mitochondrial-like [Pollicipes pollicipes]XP_037083553.1 lipoyltransferase 1, mitochondrial-like [Pollicipes pollicipes]XP_037083554.1 lipoyltransferase 1, mitochondrial-like [Pollicipes pollicipes]
MSSLLSVRRVLGAPAIRLGRRALTTGPPPEALSVFLSQSNNVFTNLALEDWLYKNFRFGRHNVLMVWRNSPCVVVGRHQNPWREVNTEYLRAASLPLARRNSGGGTVYHDMGNLNLTFFTSREQYDRGANLALVAEALRQGWGFDISVSGRDDILLDNVYKISGTAAKLTRDSAYHHCTLMVNVDTDSLQAALQPPPHGLESRATESVPAQVRNLADGAPSVSMDKIVAAIGQLYLKQAGRQASRGFQMVNPTDEWFPGLTELERGLAAPAWVYGKTPQFWHTFRLPACSDVEVRVEVKGGLVTAVEPLRPDNSADMTGTEWVRSILPSAFPELLSSLVGSKYSSDIPRQVEGVLLGKAAGSSDRRLLAM